MNSQNGYRFLLLFLPAFSHIRCGGSCYSPTTRIQLIWLSPTAIRVFIVIAELSAAMAAIKETAGLARIINDAKTDAEVKAATIELQSKLITLQAECFSLGDVIRLRDEEAVRLKNVIAEYESFEKKTEDFFLDRFETDALVYSAKKVIGGEETLIHYCSQCFNQRVISILQPSSQTFYDAAREQHYTQLHCQKCDAVYGKNKMHFKELNYGSTVSWE
ncbi:TPA: hypothetical protein ACKFQ5_001127 [Citrobacter amalonaticus]